MLCRLLVPAALLAAGAAFAGEASPEVQLCLSALRESERSRAEKALGPLDELPLYRAQLDIDPAAREVTGKLVVTWSARAKTVDELYLRVTPNAAEGARVKLFNLTVNGQPAVLGHPEPSLYKVELGAPVPPGAAAIIAVSFKAKVPRAPADSEHLGAAQAKTTGDYGAFMAAPEMMNLVGILPAVPPADEDGEPSAGPSGLGDIALYEPSNWLVSATVPAGYQVHASGNALGEVPEPGGKVRFSFATAASRDFPLFVSKGYRVETTKVDDVVIESHFLAADAEVGKEVLRYAAQAIVEYQKRLGPLPFTHFRVVEARLTGGAGGMEFPGLVTVSTALYRGVGNPLAAMGMPGLDILAGLPGFAGGAGNELVAKMKQMVEFTVAHEVAHQYFAGLVGSDPVGAPAVDETLAQHTALLYMEWKHGKAVAEQLRKTDLVSAYQLYRLSGGKDGAVDRPASEFDSGLEYGALVYGKGPLLHHEERKLLGDAAYQKGLRGYVDEYRLKWACRDCFTQVLVKQNPGKAKQLEALRRRWWDEAHGDEDLGAPDLGNLISGMTGTPVDAETAKLLEALLPQLMGQ